MASLTSDRLPTVHTTGEATAPAAGTVIADSGAMAAGVYEVLAHIGADDTAAVAKAIVAEHRNAANTATLHRYRVPVPGSGLWWIPLIQLALNERIRVVNDAVAAASSKYSADIYIRSVGR